jgi:hypothetical protein
MQLITRYSLESHPGEYKTWPPDSRLIIDGHASEYRIPGYVIEAQYESPLGILLITSYDCMFEESNDFILLDERHRCIATTGLGGPYLSFLLNAHWPVNSRTIALHYYNDLFYTLEIEPATELKSCHHRLQLRRCESWRDDEHM